MHTHVTNKSIFASNVTDKIFKNVRRRPGHRDTLPISIGGDYRSPVHSPDGLFGSLSYTQMSISTSAVCRRCVTPCVCLVYLPIGVPVVWVLSTGEKTFFFQNSISIYLSIYLARHPLHRDTLATNRKTWNLDFDVGQRPKPKFNRRPHSPASSVFVRITACLPSLREKSISIYFFILPSSCTV